ncbi:MAG: prepilin-type N-terminal cleavage/methylation domain-containing protein [Candidatus Omnitrophota bacterium]
MKNNGKKAFTFIELIIAVTIFSIIAVSIYSTFRAGIRVWLRANPVIEESQANRVFFETVARDLKRAFIYTYPDGAVKFDASADRVSFMTMVDVASAGALPHEEYARVTYSLNPEEMTIERAVAGRGEGFDELYARRTVLLNGIRKEEFGFAYCYKGPSADQPYEWKAAWEDSNKVPRGVKITAGDSVKTVFIPMGELGGAT